MADYVKVAELASVPANTGLAVEVQGKALALFRVEGGVHAIGNTCLHRGAPLAGGALEGEVVTCPWHGWQWNVKTGALLMQPDVCVARYDVRVEGGDVLVAL